MGRIPRIVSALLIVLLILIGGFFGCREFSAAQSRVDINKIKITQLNSSELPTGISYSFKLRNGTGHTIKQNTVYLSFPIKNLKGVSTNNFKIEAAGNKLDIKPNEELTLSFFCQREDYVNNASLDIQHPNLEIKGFIDTVTEENHFEKSGGLAFFAK